MRLLNSRSAAIIIILLISVSVYANTLSNDFAYDDMFQVLQNEWIKDIKNIPDILFSNAWSFMGKEVPLNYYRPTMHLIYMIDYHLFGMQPWGFHLTNIIFHTMNSILVFLIASILFGPPEVKDKKQVVEEKGGSVDPRFTIHSSRVPAFITGVLFATHPINTEAVAWIAGIPELTFVFFYLISFYLYITHSADFKRYILSLAFFFLAVFSKETGLTLLIVIFVYDLAFRVDSTNSKQNLLKKYLPYIIVMGIYMAMRFYALGGIAPQKLRHDYLSTFQYVINVFPLIVQYFEKLILPISLNAFYVLHPVYSILETKSIISLLLTLSFFILLFLLKKRSSLAFFALSWIFIPLIPVLYIPGVGDNTFTERYLYLSSAGFSILLAYAIKKIYEQLLYKNRTILISALTIIFIFLIGLYSTKTVRRNFIWKNNFSLWSDTVKKSPESAMAHYNLGIEFSNKRLSDPAIAEFKEAIKIAPNYTDAHYNLGAVYQNAGLPEKAMAEYKMVLRLNPNSADVYYNIGLIYTQLDSMDEAILAFQEALRIKPDYMEARRYLETIQGKLKK